VESDSLFARLLETQEFLENLLLIRVMDIENVLCSYVYIYLEIFKGEVPT